MFYRPNSHVCQPAIYPDDEDSKEVETHEAFVSSTADWEQDEHYCTWLLLWLLVRLPKRVLSDELCIELLKNLRFRKLLCYYYILNLRFFLDYNTEYVNQLDYGCQTLNSPEMSLAVYQNKYLVDVVSFV